MVHRITKHTPGPWTIEDPLDDNLSIVQAGKQPHEWFFIANCMIPDEDDHDFTFMEVKANARLIAAAPDLLANLVAISALTGRFAEYVGKVDHNLFQQIEVRLAIANAVIAKATGVP